MALNVFDLLTATAGAHTESGNPRYISVADATGTFVPFGVNTLNNLAVVTRSVPWTGSSASTSGEPVDDKIIAEFGAYYWDTHFDTFQVDPETGQPENRHWTTAMQILLSKYGVLGPRGEMIAPKYGLEEQASSKVSRVDASSGIADSPKPDI